MSGAEAAAWAVSRWVSVDGVRVRYREAGSGPPLVLVHGLGISADYWFRNGSALASEGLRVLAPDLPGFGRSSDAPPAEGPGAQARALDRWAAALDLPAAVYVGHSLSCQSVLQLAAAVPGRVRGLVLEGPTVGGGVLHRLRQVAQLAADAPLESPALVAQVAATYLRAGPWRVVRTWWRGGKHQPLHLLPGVEAPAIVVVGSRDPVVTPPVAAALAAGLREGRVVWIEGGSHAVHHSRPEAFNRTVARFALDVHGVREEEPPGAGPPADPRSPRRAGGS